MTIDKDTGSITLQEINAAISLTLSRSQFLQATAFSTAKVAVCNEPWCSYILQRIPQPETEISILFQFHEERLIQLHLSHAAARFGSSWNDWSEKLELERKAYHERWLSQELHVHLGYYPWGSIASEFDRGGGSSSIIISYDHPNA